jgi:hypothetical protein
MQAKKTNLTENRCKISLAVFSLFILLILIQL